MSRLHFTIPNTAAIGIYIQTFYRHRYLEKVVQIFDCIVMLDLNGEERLVLVTEHRIKYNVVMNKWLGGQIFATRSRLLCFRALKALSWTSGC